MEEELSTLPVDSRTAIVIMSHNFTRDLKLLGTLLPLPAGYVGMIGPRRRTDLLLSKLDKGAPISLLRSPAGLDIASQTPEEIALSIVSEIQAVMNGRSGGPLVDRPGPIHERP